MVKRLNMSLKDLDPEGIVRHEDVVGLAKLEEWYMQKEYNDMKRAQARQKFEARHRGGHK